MSYLNKSIHLGVECFGYDVIGMRMHLVLLVAAKPGNDHYSSFYDRFIKAVIIICSMQFKHNEQGR